ncbi:endothelin-converting enzyme-like 1 [Stomoxys calcitrans]|uniref:endothelin-converting enzyme-like 1 n=1 Tax=Stomoxys calcitrans TaxID=35570 RepID=UPI0027E283E0|nr:endothelin-converting enzyme-like 1 [Stomoxys calcitrans]
MALLSNSVCRLLIAAAWTLALAGSVVTARPPTSHDHSGWDYVNKSCLSRECDEHVNIKHLQHLATHINRAAHPCENFHEYACGHWKQQHSEPTMMAVGEKLLIEKYQKIFAAHKNPEELRSDGVYQKLQQYYEVCVQSERKEKARWQDYIQALRDMQLLQFNNETHWLTTLRDLSEFSNLRFFIYGDVERFNASLYMLNLYPHDSELVANLSEDIYQILRHYNYTQDSREVLKQRFANLESELADILNSSCSNMTPEAYEALCDSSEWMSWQALGQRNSSINWQWLFASYPLEPQDLIAVNNFTAMNSIKQYLDSCSQQTLFLYSLTRFINHLQACKHNTVTEGSSPPTCLRHMRKLFPLGMNYLYDKRFYNHQERSLSDPVIKSVFEQLKHHFNLRLDNNPMHLTPQSIQYLKMKLQGLQLNIGNMPLNRSQEFYEALIADLNLSSHHDFYQNHLQALRHFHSHLRVLVSPTKFPSVWHGFNLHMPDMPDNFDTTAYYLASANLIVLPFAYLQQPFYDHRFWPSLLYGDLATTLGHELMHAFDTYFLRNDYGGNYNEKESLEILSNSQFQKNLRCLQQTPTKFITERIADISGTRLALNAFAQDPLFMKHNGKLFFLQFAQFFCGSADEQTFASQDPLHDMDSMRLNYALAHTSEFGESFKCPLGSPMNPLEKCELW